ncbi:MAG TPA: hypothetical protein VMZ53_31470 [Kofleriaceae bacterium]|nr:hypothetical protein [Kofleriaceae bacterium]
MTTKQNKPERPEEYERSNEGDEGASILQKEQSSFVDEDSPRGKQFGASRKVADQDRVGAASPDADSDELPKQPQK